VTVSRAEKRRAVMVDLAIGLGYPLLMIALQYIVQGHRFNIFEDIGCFPFTYNTPPAFVLVHCQPVLIGLVSAVYCALSIRLFWKRHAQFNELLSGHRNLNANRYLRLMFLAGIEMLCTIPIGAWSIAANVQAGVFPWLGWEDTHYGFSRVDLIPAIFWRRDPASVSGLECTRWSPVVCAIVFFAFFGFADEARKHYRSAVESVAKKVGYSTFTLTGSKTGTSGTMDSTATGTYTKGGFSSTGKIRPTPPVHIHTDMLGRQRSIDSFTNVSVSFHDAGALLDEKEKGFSPDATIGALSMSEVHGIKPDYNSDCLSSPSSGSSSASSSASSPAHSSVNLPSPTDSSPKESDRSAV